VKVLFYAVSRKREFLADAIAVQLTRYPEGLASALEKIRNNAQEQLSVNSMNEAMFIVNPYCSSAMSIWNIGKTHPSTTDRIRILRSIGAAEGFGNYHEAFRSTTGMQHRQMARSKKLQDILEIRPAFEEATYSDTSDQPAAQNAFPETHSHSFIDCTCGMKLKIPDGFGTNKPEVICPACGRRYAV
jgi:heat shock protein HtpX